MFGRVQVEQDFEIATVLGRRRRLEAVSRVFFRGLEIDKSAVLANSTDEERRRPHPFGTAVDQVVAKRTRNRRADTGKTSSKLPRDSERRMLLFRRSFARLTRSTNFPSNTC